MWKKRITQDIILAIKVVLAITVVTLFVGLFIWSTWSWKNIKWQLFFNCYYGFPLTFVNSWLLGIFDRTIPWDNNPKKRAWAGMLGTIVITMLTLILLNIIFIVGIRGGSIGYVFSDNMKGNYLTGLIITILVTMTLHAIGFFKVATDEKLNNEKLRKEKLQSELNALRAHIDPHFLFNSFNILSGLMDENVDKAQDFLAGLSKIYRYILENRTVNKSSIEDELHFAKRYLTLQQFRFEDSIHLDIDVANEYKYKALPSLTLQLLLENAIKHNAFDEKMPLVVRIFIENEQLVVKNNKRARSLLYEGNGMGLKNIRDRYSLLSKEKMLVEETADDFIVRLPILNSDKIEVPSVPFRAVSQ